MKKIFKTVILGAMVIFCSGCGNATPVRSQFVDTAMGTVIQQSLYAVEEESAKAFSDEVMALLNELEQEKLSWRSEASEVHQLNASAGTAEGYVVSEELKVILQRCLEITESSGGAFDVTLGAVVRLWNIDSWASGQQSGTFQVPSGEALEQALGQCGSKKLTWTKERVFLPEGLQIDLGAVGKGIALSGIHRLLEDRTDISGAVISAGGSILTYGSKPDGSSWKVGIVNPLDTSENIGVLSLEGGWVVSTSGDYERYVEADGVRYHHIINPVTGYPADSGVRGVTILSKDGLLGDALSTSCFILGAEKGIELAAEYEAEVLFVLSDGEIVMSEGMKQYFRGM